MDFRDRLFHESTMYKKVEEFAIREGLTETQKALVYMKEHHMGQFRYPAKHTKERILYINHPLMMARQAQAAGLKDDVLFAAILLHDVVEDTDVSVSDLPFSEAVREIVDLVSFEHHEGNDKNEEKREYYRRIGENTGAGVVKILDRCNNVSTMALSFSREKMEEYIDETEKYIMPIIQEIKSNHKEYEDVAFLVKYQILSVLETIKNLLSE